MALQNWFKYEGTEVFRVDASVYTYKTSYVALDADGSPRAYHPQDHGLDYNANAGYPNKGWRSVLVLDPVDPDKPYIQTRGPTAGYFLSKTSLMDPDPAVPATNPAKYVDAETFPYIVFPGGFYAIHGTGNWGDIVMVRSLVGGQESVAVVADGGPTKAPLGEISLKLATALGGHNPSPRTGAGAPQGPIQYVIFPGSRPNPPWPRTIHDIQQQGATLLHQMGAWPAIP
jgi:hypothetical protein